MKGVREDSRTPKIIEKVLEGPKLCPKHDIPVPPPKRTLENFAFCGLEIFFLGRGNILFVKNRLKIDIGGGVIYKFIN